MDATLAGLKWKNLIVYLDDIIIFSSSFDEHIKDLREVFGRLKDAHLKLKPSKCYMAQYKIHYLGHVISADGIEPSVDKIEAIRQMKIPSNKKELRTWLGMCSYYRKFIPQFAKLCAPLYKLTHVDSVFEWGPEYDKILNILRCCLTTAPKLQHPDFNYPFTIRTDASTEGLGATLSQMIDEKERIIQYLSRTVLPNEKKWPVRELEALAIVWACGMCRQYVIGTHFIIETDHESLQWLKQAKTARLVRWACALSEYDFTIRYRPGNQNQTADALSRLPTQCNENQKRTGILDYNYEALEAHELNHLREHYAVEGISHEKLKKEQREDSTLNSIIQDCERLENIPKISQFVIEKGLLFKIKQGNKLLMIPSNLKENVLKSYHNHATSVHMSRDKLYDMLKVRFYWPGMYLYIQDYVKNCL